jgi:hypothetical protein
MNGQSQTKSISKAFPISVGLVLEALLLIAAGFFVMFLRTKLRIPLHLPGHHGVEYMVIIVTARMLSRYKWTAILTAIGISTAFLVPGLGMNDPFKLIAYLLPCITLDILYQLNPKWHNKPWTLGLLAGFSYALIPTFRLIMSLITGMVFPSLLTGIAWPFLTHFFFGMTGAMIALGVLKLAKKN